MAPPNNPGVARVAMLFSRDTRTFVNTFHCAKVNGQPWLATELGDLGQQFVDWWNDWYRQYASDGTCLTQVQVRVYDPTNPISKDVFVSPPVCGTQGVAEAPGSATQTISWRTGLAGRRYRGRDYAVGLGDVAIADDDRVTSPYTALLAQAAFNLILQLFNAGIALVVFHRADDTVTGIISFVIDALLDSQRRRLPGRGR